MSYITIKDKLILILKTITDFKDSYTASTLSFSAATKTVTDSAAGLAFVQAGDNVTITGSGSNNGTYKVTTGNTAGSFVVDGTLVNENIGAAVTLALPTHVSHGDYSLLDKGIGNCIVLIPGPASESLKQARSLLREWTFYADMFVKFTDEPVSWLAFVTLRSSVLDALEKYPILNNLSGIERVTVACNDDPNGVFDSQGNGPMWFSQRFEINVTERTDLSGGDYA
jgi:hypothetical protein